MATKKEWGELGGRSRVLDRCHGDRPAAPGGGALRHQAPSGRPINGPKWMWTPVTFVTIVGPLAYFAFGRRRGGSG